MSYLPCSSRGKPVPLDLQRIGKKEAPSHSVPRARLGGDSGRRRGVPVWQVRLPVGEGGAV